VFEGVEPGGQLDATWQVTAPPQDEPAAAYELRVRAAYAVGGAAAEQETAEPVYVVEPVGTPYGESWTTVGSAVVPTAAVSQDVGVVCCSHSTVLGRALFEGLAITG
jgi:hypothetical protein